jgi:hypothetical protein
MRPYIACAHRALEHNSFDYKNWNKGWVGALTRKIFDDLDAEVITMTRANFSKETYDAYVVGMSGGACVRASVRPCVRACVRVTEIAANGVLSFRMLRRIILYAVCVRNCL